LDKQKGLEMLERFDKVVAQAAVSLLSVLENKRVKNQPANTGGICAISCFVFPIQLFTMFPFRSHDYM
jgi:hypothetical protein